LINFAEAWKNNSNVKASAISDFFTFFFNDFFEAEIDGSGYPVSSFGQFDFADAETLF